MDKIYQRLTPLFRDVFDDDTIVVTPALTARDVETWDSLSNIRLMVGIEQEFGIRFETAEIAGLPNVGALVDVINARLDRKQM
jgi:acyl carrier protein